MARKAGGRTLSDAERVEITRRFQGGEKAAVLAEIFGVTAAYVNILGARRLPVQVEEPQPTEPERHQLPEIITKVMDLHRRGLPALRIAPFVRLPYRQIERIINRHA